MPIRILIADNHETALQTIGEILDRITEIELVGRARNFRQLVELAAELSPQVVLMDISMPGAGSEQAVREIIRANSSVKVIAVSMHQERQFVERMQAAGASGYLLKEHVFDELQEALLAVVSGEDYISRWIPDSRQRP